MAAAMVVVSVGTVPREVDAASRFKTVTKTFSESQEIFIPLQFAAGSATPYPSEINARSFKRGKIVDVNVKLEDFSHTNPADIDVMVSHRGVNRIVMFDVSGDEDISNITLRLDDEADNPLPGDPLTSGRFRPTNALGGGESQLDPFPVPAPAPGERVKLSGFDGENPNGSWKL